MHPALRSFRFTLALAFVLIALPALAATPVADVNLGFNNVTWTPQSEYAGLRLTVSGPDGNTWQNSFDANEAPQLDLSALGSAVDGLYTWELRATPMVDQVKITGQSRTSEAGTRVRSKDLPSRDSLVQSGSFRVLNGTIVQPAAEQDAPGLVIDTPGVDSATAGLERATAADNVILDDQIVDGSLCVGMDCINGENFGFDTIRLKENNLRIHFQDTSNSGSFPTRDWRLVANGNQNGDPEYFSIQDAGTSRDVFYVEADAPSHALHVDSAGGGRIGVKTSAPVVDIHVVEGNTPTLRLDQDGSDGFNPQVWDIAGNETNFFIRDVSNGSALPFKIFPGADTNALVIDAESKVGVGIQNVTENVQLQVNTAKPNAALFRSTDGNNVAFLLIENANSTDFNQTGVGSFNDSLILRAGDATRLTVEADGSLTSDTGASLTVGGVWTDASSRALKHDITELSADDAMATLEGLSPVTYRYNVDPAEQYVGFIAEDVPDLVAMNHRKGLAPMEIVAVLTQVVKQQQAQIDALSERLENDEEPAQ